MRALTQLRQRCLEACCKLSVVLGIYLPWNKDFRMPGKKGLGGAKKLIHNYAFSVHIISNRNYLSKFVYVSWFIQWNSYVKNGNFQYVSKKGKTFLGLISLNHIQLKKIIKQWFGKWKIISCFYASIDFCCLTALRCCKYALRLWLHIMCSVDIYWGHSLMCHSQQLWWSYYFNTILTM